MRFIILSGMSGSGKMAAYQYFSDAGYYACDNVPPALLLGLATWARDAGHSRLAAVVDTRCGSAIAHLPAAMDELQAAGVPAELVFLDATDGVLVRRFKETRRPHPLFDQARGTVLDAIAAERCVLDPILARASKVVDSSQRTPAELRDALSDVTSETLQTVIHITVESFGFKHGIPVDADLVFDVRFLTNPHYVASLRPLTGSHPDVAQYIHQHPLTEPFLDRLFQFVAFTLPNYQREGKAYLTIAIGCTGGRHRSVTVAEDLARHLQGEGYGVSVFHRDATREERR